MNYSNMTTDQLRDTYNGITADIAALRANAPARFDCDHQYALDDLHVEQMVVWHLIAQRDTVDNVTMANAAETAWLAAMEEINLLIAAIATCDALIAQATPAALA